MILTAATVLIYLTFIIIFTSLFKTSYKRYLLYWVLGISFYLLAYAVLYITLQGHNRWVIHICLHSLFTGGGLFLFWGMADYIGVKLSKIWFYTAAAVVFWAVITAFVKIPYRYATVASRLYVGAGYIWVGITLLRSDRMESISRWFLGVCFITFGLYNGQNPAFQAKSYLGGILGLITGIGFLLIHLKNIRRHLIEEEVKFKALFHNAKDAIFLANLTDEGRTGKLVEVNQISTEMLGYSREELLSKTPRELLVPESYHQVIKIKDSSDKEKNTFEATVIAKDGRRIPVEISSTIFTLRNRKVEMGIVRNISERKKAEKEIKYLSFHDKLTGLYNRAFFEKELKWLDNENYLPLGIIMADLNGLKFTNDLFGHQEGDKLLVGFAEVLKDICRQQDIAARWGGDEFIILLPNTSEKEVMDITDRIISFCDKKDEAPIKLSVALGAATKNNEEENIQEVIKEAENKMYKHKFLEDRSIRSHTTSSLQKALAEKSHETDGHARRMQEMVLKVGKAMSLSKSELDDLALLAVLHDIGKIAISNQILIKPGRLSEEEWEIMKKHSEIGYRIARTSAELSSIAEYIRSHHERWDGNGYPQGLKGKDIPLPARIVTIVDAYDAMTNDRPYRKKMSQEEAVKELVSCAGSQFDPEIVDIFLKVLELEAKNEKDIKDTFEVTSV